MDLKKLLLSLAVSLPLAATGCGDDGSGPNEPGPSCGEGQEVWRLTGLTLPESSADVIGFDLDGQNTTTAGDDKDPAEGCGVVDLEGGVDNQLGFLLSAEGALGGILSGSLDLDLQAEIDNAINSGKLKIEAVIANYTGAGSQNVTLTLYSQGERVVNATPVTVDEAGNLSAEISRLPISLEGIQIEVLGEIKTFDVSLTIRDGRVEIPAPGASNTATAVIGGGVPYTGAGNDSFRNTLEGLVDALDLGITLEQIEGIITPELDLASTGSSECNALSLGAAAAFQKQPCE